MEMNFERRYEVFTEVFNNVDGMKISHNGKSKLSAEKTKNMIYGEINFNGLLEIFQEPDVRDIRDGMTKAKTFYDLGSGTGKIIIGTALLFPNLEKLIGIDLVPELIEASLINKKKLSEFEKKSADKIELINENFFDVNFSTADVVFMHYPMHGEGSEELYLKLEEKMQSELKTGSIIFSMIRKLRNLTEFPEFVKSKKISTSYGHATVYSHKKA